MHGGRAACRMHGGMAACRMHGGRAACRMHGGRAACSMHGGRAASCFHLRPRHAVEEATAVGEGEYTFCPNSLERLAF